MPFLNVQEKIRLEEILHFFVSIRGGWDGCFLIVAGVLLLVQVI